MMGVDSNRKLYVLVAALAAAVAFVAAGGGVTGAEGHWIGHWQHRIFHTLCHQDPARSLWINGTPMAVCSRCFGLYSSFALLWLAIPLTGRIHKFFPGENMRYLLAIAVVLNAVDVAGNVMGVWENTLFSRFFMGSALGLAAVLFLSDEFISTTGNLNRDRYGITRTT